MNSAFYGYAKKNPGVQPYNTDTIVSGYTDKITYNPGDSIYVYISSSAIRKHVKLYFRDIEGKMIDSVIADLKPQTIYKNKPWENGFRFEVSFAYKLPLHMPSGIYNWENKIFVIVRNPSKHSDITIVYPTNTEQAYNEAGSKSLYDFNSIGGKANIVTFQRPLFAYGITQIRTYCKRFLEWIGDLGAYDIQYISDMDMDDYSQIENSKILMVIGHSEYWTRDARINFDAFVNSGHDAIILSGNTMWWQVRYSQDKTKLICYKDSLYDPEQDPILKTINWTRPSLGFPPLGSIGVDFEHGAYGMMFYHGWQGYKVLKSRSPLLAGTGLDFHQIISCQSEEYDGALLNGFNLMDDPILDTTSLGFCKMELIGYDWGKSIYATGPQKSYGTFIAFKKFPGSGNVINVGFSNWCAKNGGQGAMGGFGDKDSTIIKQITLNMINTLLEGNTIFTEPNDCLALSENTKTISVNLYPNPSHGNIVFTSNVAFPSGTLLKIYNNLGIMMLQKSVANQFGTHIEISGFPSGIYFYRINDGLKCSFEGKLIKID
ncbi:MAG: N,N-dimethylformamidase beta subunit family domain-containing protein [Bacteroidota bacterium]